jgi:nucleoside 2-deoxyribosyltransferase
MAAGPEADDYWQKYEQGRGHNYKQSLAGFAATHVYDFDRYHLERADIGILFLPAGKSGHLELGWLLGKGKPGYILLCGEPERFDVMYKFANGVFNTFEELAEELNKKRARTKTI